MYISEKRLAGTSDEESNVISPGSRTICHAMATISTSQENANHHQLQVKVKLDSCGSVSIAHSDHLIRIRDRWQDEFSYESRDITSSEARW